MKTAVFTLILLSLLFSSCKNSSFLSKKYAFNKLKTHSTDQIKPIASNKLNSILVSNTKISLLANSNDVDHSAIKPITFNSNTIKPKNLIQKSITLNPLHKIKGSLKQSIKKNNLQNQSKKDYSLVKAILLVICFWVIAIVIYSNVLVIELASILATIKILGVILMALTVWLILYYLFKLLTQKI